MISCCGRFVFGIVCQTNVLVRHLTCYHNATPLFFPHKKEHTNKQKTTTYILIAKTDDERPGSSCSKHCYLNEHVSGQNVNCSTKYNIYFTNIFAEKKNVSSFSNANVTHIFFSKYISVYAIFNAQSFNDVLTNNIVSFEQHGPDILSILTVRRPPTPPPPPPPVSILRKSISGRHRPVSYPDGPMTARYRFT